MFRSEGRFRDLIENSADGVIVVYPDGLVAYANPAAEQLLGRDPGKLHGALFGIPLAPGDTTEIDVCHGGEPRIAEMRVSSIDWQDRPASLAVFRDITERKRVSNTLQFLSEASNLLAGSLDLTTTLTSVARLAVQHLADWCLIDIVEGDLVGHEQPFLRRLAAGGVSVMESDAGEPLSPAPEAAQARQLCGRFPLGEGTVASVARVIRMGTMEVFQTVGLAELHALALDAGQLPILQGLGCRSALIAPMVARGRALGAITFLSSTPWRTYGPHEQVVSQDLCDRAALAVDNARLYDESREALRRRDEFLAMLAHELRNPLAPILHAVELMKVLQADSDSQRRLRDTIERQGKHLARLLDDLLDLSRVTHGKIDLRMEQLDLALVIKDAIQVSSSLLEARRHQLNVHLGDGSLFVEGDPTRLTQVFGNLLTNAARYTEPGGMIDLRAQLDRSEVLVTVRDNGKGIPAGMLGRIFEPFYQVDPTLDRNEGGLGIGLALVRRLVELHAGRVLVWSDGPGKGSTFEVRLPMASSAVPVQGKAEVVSQTNCRILLVEDNADGRDMLGDLLRIWGHEVEGVGDGIRGLERMRQSLPDVALIDIGLPGLDGYQLAARVRALPGGDAVFLVAVTGYGQPTDRERALAVGFDRHLVKPVNLDELARILEEASVRTSPTSSASV